LISKMQQTSAVTIQRNVSGRTNLGHLLDERPKLVTARPGPFRIGTPLPYALFTLTRCGDGRGRLLVRGLGDGGESSPRWALALGAGDVDDTLRS